MYFKKCDQMKNDILEELHIRDKMINEFESIFNYDENKINEIVKSDLKIMSMKNIDDYFQYIITHMGILVNKFEKINSEKDKILKMCNAYECEYPDNELLEKNNRTYYEKTFMYHEKPLDREYCTLTMYKDENGIEHEKEKDPIFKFEVKYISNSRFFGNYEGISHIQVANKALRNINCIKDRNDLDIFEESSFTVLCKCTNVQRKYSGKLIKLEKNIETFFDMEVEKTILGYEQILTEI